MDRSRLAVLSAASHVLSDEHPDRESITVLNDYARANLPEKADLPLDELATVVALKLMDADVDSLP